MKLGTIDHHHGMSVMKGLQFDRKFEVIEIIKIVNLAIFFVSITSNLRFALPIIKNNFFKNRIFGRRKSHFDLK